MLVKEAQILYHEVLLFTIRVFDRHTVEQTSTAPRNIALHHLLILSPLTTDLLVLPVKEARGVAERRESGEGQVGGQH
jgi:hypothetical protein